MNKFSPALFDLDGALGVDLRLLNASFNRRLNFFLSSLYADNGRAKATGGPDKFHLLSKDISHLHFEQRRTKTCLSQTGRHPLSQNQTYMSSSVIPSGILAAPGLNTRIWKTSVPRYHFSKRRRNGLFDPTESNEPIESSRFSNRDLAGNRALSSKTVPLAPAPPPSPVKATLGLRSPASTKAMAYSLCPGIQK